MEFDVMIRNELMIISVATGDSVLFWKISNIQTFRLRVRSKETENTGWFWIWTFLISWIDERTSRGKNVLEHIPEGGGHEGENPTGIMFQYIFATP